MFVTLISKLPMPLVGGQVVSEVVDTAAAIIRVEKYIIGAYIM